MTEGKVASAGKQIVIQFLMSIFSVGKILIQFGVAALYMSLILHPNLIINITLHTYDFKGQTYFTTHTEIAFKNPFDLIEEE